MTTRRTSSTSASVMMETNTPAMRLRNTMVPMIVAIATGSTTPMKTPNHLCWNGSHRNDALLMQHSSVGDPGSAFHSMKSGTGLSEPCCRLVGLASLTEIEDSCVSPRQRYRDAEHAEYQILGDAIEPEWFEHQRRAHDEGKERQIDCDLEAALVGHCSAPF